MSIIKDRRIGTFRISLQLIDTLPEAIKLIMARVIVIRANFDLVSESIEYVVICDAFSPIDPSQIVPSYSAVMAHKDECIEFIRWDGGSCPAIYDGRKRVI